jgi:transcriptional antiterminator NusG
MTDEVNEVEEANEEGEVSEVLTRPNMKWYVIHTYSGHENKVKASLERAVLSAGLEEKIGRVLVATENVTEMKDGKKTVTTRKFFPSYVLVEMDLDTDTLHLVNNTPGVTHFVTEGTRPVPLRDEEVERVLGQVEGARAKPAVDIPYRIGDHVKVVDGPFTDFSGVVEEINPERGKLKVMVSIFGRATPVELDFLQVKNL